MVPRSGNLRLACYPEKGGPIDAKEGARAGRRNRGGGAVATDLGGLLQQGTPLNHSACHLRGKKVREEAEKFKTGHGRLPARKNPLRAACAARG